MPDTLRPLRDFVTDMTDRMRGGLAEAQILAEGERELRRLIAADDWLPEACATPHPERARQYLLYLDPDARFSVVSVVWGPGQGTPIHDHTVWGLVGVLRGAELNTPFAASGAGLVGGPTRRLAVGDTERLSQADGDIHRVENAFHDRTSISIHVYGGNIGAITRSAYALDGTRTPFVTAYADVPAPDLGDLLRPARPVVHV